MLEPSETYKPFKYPWAVELTQKHEIDLHWHEKEVNLQQDVQQWKDGTLTDAEKEFITHTLRLFTQSDVAVGEVYKKVLIPNIGNNEVSNLLTSFANRESTHQRAYALIPESLGFDDSEWHAFLEYAEMKDKWDFMKYASRDLEQYTDQQVAISLIDNVFFEGVSLFGSFAMLLWFKQRAKMLGMCQVVEWSLRDESLHVEGNTRLFRECAASLGLSHQYEVYAQGSAKALVELEDAFIDKAFAILPRDSAYLDADDLKYFIRYLADRRLIGLGFDSVFHVREVPASMKWFLEVTLAPRHTNFFEGRVTDYTVSGMTGELKWD